MSGLFKSFVDLLDNDLLIATPSSWRRPRGPPARDGRRRAAATAVRVPPCHPVPTSLFARARRLGVVVARRPIARAATELVLLLRSGVGRLSPTTLGRLPAPVLGQRHPAEAGRGRVDFDTDLMRLAAGGGR
jgi:FMN reductase